MSQKKRILVCPLDWGLGHATRCVPIIEALLGRGMEVLLGTDGHPAALLKEAFPMLEQIQFPGYEIEYPAGDHGMALKMLFATPRLRIRIKEEQQTLEQFIKQHQIDGVISDNRFGLFTDQVPCVYLTHQLQIQAPAFKGALRKLHRSYIDRYTFCWIPDFEGADNLSGALSHGMDLPKGCRYIGPLSRLTKQEQLQVNTDQLCVLLSGPEPQRTSFEQTLLKQLQNHPGSVILVRGLPGTKASLATPPNVKAFNHLSGDQLATVLQSSGMTLSRPGYSTLMDLTALGVKAIFVPTPGQTEQEYLAQLHREKGSFYATRQKGFELEAALEASAPYTGIQRALDKHLLAAAINEFLAVL